MKDGGFLAAVAASFHLAGLFGVMVVSLEVSPDIKLGLYCLRV